MGMGAGTLHSSQSLGGDFGKGLCLLTAHVDGEFFTESYIRV